MTRTLTAAFHREDEWYIARCLELEVASQGRTLDEAKANLAEAVELYVAETGGNPGRGPGQRIYEKAGHTALPAIRYFRAL